MATEVYRLQQGVIRIVECRMRRRGRSGRFYADGFLCLCGKRGRGVVGHCATIILDSFTTKNASLAEKVYQSRFRAHRGREVCCCCYRH